MVIITENYVSFKTAKLLKEKGFNEPTLYYYVAGHLFQHYSLLSNSDNAGISAPTFQMAMKWLRIEHNIHIEPHIVRTKCSYGYMPNYININDLTQHFPFKEIDFCDLEKYVCITYDKACEVAIKYCLENLI